MSDPKRRALGRGLGALITNTEVASTDPLGSEPATGSAGVRQVPIHAIQPNPRQPRTHFDEEALNDLAASIRAHGLIQPLVLTTNPRRPDLYALIAGERRWRAAQRAGLQSVPAIIREANDQQLVELALIENVQRADLDPLEEAHAYATLLDEFGLTQAEVAERVGKSRSAVANAVRLLHLPQPVQESLAAGQISAGHARSLLALPDANAMIGAMHEVIHRGLNVRQTEALVKRLLDEAARPPAPVEEVDAQVRAQVAHLEERFRQALGTRVSLARNANGSGRLVIHFYNDGDLDALFQSIAGGDEALPTESRAAAMDSSLDAGVDDDAFRL
jgi:ParB family chromosome partitioning protein